MVLERTPHEYSYKDSSGYHFLDPNTYEDAVVYEDLIEGVKNYLIEGQLYNLMVADGVVVAVDLPLSMVMTVAESSEGVKGDSANNVYKPAVMETGLIVQVPLFINVGREDQREDRGQLLHWTRLNWLGISFQSPGEPDRPKGRTNIQ